MTSLRKRALTLAITCLAILLASCSKKNENAPIVIRGAIQFEESHTYARTLRKFEELVKLYYAKPVEFELYLNSELGLEKDYFTYMSQGVSVDYAIVSPSHMATFSKSAPIMDMPFIYRDLEHWKKVLNSDAFDSIAAEVSKNADVRIIGYSGGATRNLIVNRPVTNMDELKGLSIRVMGAPIQSRIFQAITAAPTVISYNEIYNAIQTGVIDAAENEAEGIRYMKFYEVGPEISLTQHAITVRPISFSGKTLRRLPEDLQAAILKAGREAGEHGRELEISANTASLKQMETDGLLRTHTFTQRDELLKLSSPVVEKYAQEIGAEGILANIKAIK